MKRLIFTFMIAFVATIGSSWAQCDNRYSQTNLPDGYLTNDLAFDFDDDTKTLTIAPAASNDNATHIIPDFTASQNPWSKMGEESFRDRIKKVVICASVTRIGDNAFYQLPNLEEVEIPNSVTSIGKYAFDGCTKLTKINLPANLESIGDGAFSSCASLNSITIPASVTSLGNHFVYYSALRKIKVLSDTPLSINEQTLLLYPVVSSQVSTLVLIVPAGAKSAYESAAIWKDFGLIVEEGASYPEFHIEDNKLIKYWGDKSNVTIPNVVTRIEPFAFYGNQHLEQVHIPSGVTGIGMRAFMHCPKLTSVDIPDGVWSIGGEAFMNCSSLSSVSIPKSVIAFDGSSAFVGCDNLQTVTVAWDVPIGIISYLFGFIDLSELTLIVPTGTVALYEAATVWKDFGTITDGSPVVTSDFEVSASGELTGYNGPGVGDITIPNTVKKMSLGVFPALAELGTIYIPEGVTEILDDGRSHMLFVEAFSVASTNPNYSSENGVLYNKDKTVLLKYPNLSTNTTYVLPNSVQGFYQSAFAARCLNLEYMVISCMLDNLPIGCSFGMAITDEPFKALEITGTERVSPIVICLTGNSGQCNTMEGRTLIVPVGMKAAYVASGNWNCANIVEKGGSTTPVEIEPGFMKIKSITNTSNYLGEWEMSPNILGMSNINQYPNANVKFYVDAISSSEYVLALNAVKIGNYIKGQYAFNSRTAGFPVADYMFQTNHGLGIVNAIRTGNTLYILGDNVAVNQVSDIDAVVNNSAIRKIDLNNDKSFVFSFVPFESGSTDFMIKSAEPSSNPEYVKILNGAAILSTGTPTDVFAAEKVAGSLEEITSAQLDVSTTSINFAASGGTRNFGITAKAVTWTITSSAQWATVNTVSGSSDATITVSASANTTTSPRTATITVKGGDITRTVSITQAKAEEPPTPVTELNVSTTSLDFDSSSGTKTFGITSNVAWTITCSDDWLTTNTASGSGNATITVSVSANNTPSTSTATLTITGGGVTRTVTITQDGRAAEPAPTPAAQMNVSTTSLDFSAAGGASTFNITSNTAWSISRSAQWAAISAASGLSDTTITVSALENVSASSRTMTLTVTAGNITRTITLTQSGTAANNNDEPIVATPSQPADNKGTVDLSLNIPSDKSLTGEFTVTMPAGFILDKDKTILAPELQSNHSLEISEKSSGVWTFKIGSMLSTRSASDVTYRSIVEIAYTIDDKASTGNYNIKISDLDFTMSDNTKIKEQDIDVTIPYSSVGNALIANDVKVACYNNTLSINSPHKERIDIYSITGLLMFSEHKTSGEVKYNISNLPKGVVIVRGSSGWVEKVIKR